MRRSRVQYSGEARVDPSIMVGAIGGFIVFLAVILFSGQFFAYFSPTGLVLVIGGTLASGLITYSIDDMKRALRAARDALLYREIDLVGRIVFLVDLAKSQRRDGQLSLENAAQNAREQFLKVALEMVVDGRNFHEIKRILENEIKMSDRVARRSQKVFETLGTYAPAMGLIGTLIGLVEMLKVLQEPSGIGPAMSLAMLTTLYGAVFANMILLPIAGKLKLRADEDSLFKVITLEGILGLCKEEGPVELEQRLQGFLPIIRAA